jgi:hypothetical protein
MTDIGFDHHKKWTQAAAIDEKEKSFGRCAYPTTVVL